MKSLSALMLLSWLFSYSSNCFSQDSCGAYGGLTEPVCHVSHIRLIADRDKYDGKMVTFSAIVSYRKDSDYKKDDTALLYSSSDMEKLEIHDDAIIIEYDIFEKLAERGIKSGEWVNIVGRFTKRTNNEFVMAHAGAIRDVVAITPSSR